MASSKCVPPTSRETKIWCTPPTVSSQAIQGTVGFAGFIVPAATRGSSASAEALLFCEHWPSMVAFAAHGPPPAELSRTPCPALPTVDPVEPAIDGAGRRRRHDALGGEDQLVGVQSADAGRALLVPDDPRHRVVRTGERDVGLDAVPGRVDVQRRIGRGDPLDADLLPAEAADRRRCRISSGRLHAGAVDRSRTDGLLDEDLILPACRARPSPAT